MSKCKLSAQNNGGVTIVRLKQYVSIKMNHYVGRFAPSPTGKLHAGSLVAALASYLDARAHDGEWLIRIEDVDTLRCHDEFSQSILEVLSQLHLYSDREIIFQSHRTERYQAVFDHLKNIGRVYGCSCSRREIDEADSRLGLPHGCYPGTCRNGAKGPVRSYRFRTSTGITSFKDRRLGIFEQNVENTVGDFVVKRADELFAYQLAVVVDDHDQGVTDVVRGEDLLDNTPRQLQLYQALGWSSPSYMHIPLVLNNRHEKLSKQAGARPLTDDLLKECEQAWIHLGFEPIGADSLDAFYKTAISCWRYRWLKEGEKNKLCL